MDMLAADSTAAANAYFLRPFSLLGSVLRGQTPSPSPSTHAPPPDASAATPPPHDQPPAQLLSSKPASLHSDTADDKLKKPSRRSKTSYNIARPVNTRSKRHSRNKVHLQLHQVIASQRPKPAYDVVPLSYLPQRSTRQLARFFNTREKLGHGHVLVVKAGPYTSQDEQDRSPDEWNPHDVIGLLTTRKCEKGGSESADICINDGFSRWSVTDMPNGGYEFNSTNEHSVTVRARWVLKPAHARRLSMSTSTSTLAPGSEDKKFTFSTISSDSRRHPIIATMTHSRIDVMDTYTIPSATSPPTPSVPSYTQSPITPLSIDSDSFANALADKLPIETTQALRNLILVSAVWVASREFASDGFSPATIPALTPSSSIRQATYRTCSMSTLDTPRSSSPASTAEENRRAIPRMFKPTPNHAPKDAPSSPASTKTTAKASPLVMPRARRANSTGNAIHSITGSMRRKYPLPLEDETLLESVQERHMKRSIELLGIKELQLASPVQGPSVDTTRPPIVSIPSPIVTPPSPDKAASPAPLLDSPLLSPPLPDTDQSPKTHSTYTPVETAGMWDSGVNQGSGIKRRPTSMFVMNERKRKQEKKGGRSKSKKSKTKRSDSGSDHGLGLNRKSHWSVCNIKLRFKDMFYRDKA